ncbi:MAG: alpha/beta fold hydrolase [Hyphomicrobiales bacterium]
MRYRFDGFELDTALLELRHGAQQVPLEPQVFDVLAYLVENHEQLVAKDELIEHIWPSKYISEAALNSRVMAARKAIGDSGKHQRLIKTVHGRGYRFVGTLEEPAAAVPPAPASPQLRFLTTPDGVRIAYTTTGAGPALVKAGNWLTHIQLDAANPFWRHVWQDLADGFRLIRYDVRGSGLSDWDVARLSFDAWVEDLEVLADELELDRFALLGISQGGPVAIAYAARHPERLTHLVLLGTFARGRLQRASNEWLLRHEAMRSLIEQSWGHDSDAFREIFSLTMAPDGTREQWRLLTDLQRVSASPENAARIHDVSGNVNVEALLPALTVPTLVLHARGDQRVPFDEGRRLASQIPGARFVPLESRNHLLIDGEPAWQRCFAEIQAFLGGAPGRRGGRVREGVFEGRPMNGAGHEGAGERSPVRAQRWDGCRAARKAA